MELRPETRMRLALGVALFLVVVVAGSLAFVLQDPGPELPVVAEQPTVEHEPVSPPRRAKTIWDSPEPPRRAERRHAHDTAWPPDGPAGDELLGPDVAESGALLHRRRARQGQADGPARLRVRVFDAETGEPLPNAVIRLHEAGREGEGESAVATHGGVIERTSATTVDVTVTHPGRAVACERAIPLAPGADLVLDVQLVRGRMLVMGIGAAAGVSRDRLDVELWPAEEWNAAWPVHPLPPPRLAAVVDEDGRASVDGLPRLSDWVVRLSGDGVRPDVSRVAVGPDLAPLWLSLFADRSAALRGRVVDSAGEPVPDAVVVVPSDESFPPPRYGSVVSQAAKFEVNVYRALLAESIEEGPTMDPRLRARSGTDGSFELVGLPTQTEVLLVAMHPEEGTTERAAVVTPNVGETRSIAPLVLRGRGQVVVEVVDPDRAPVVGAQVSLPSSDLLVPLSESSAGRFGPASVPAGPLAVSVRLPGRSVVEEVTRVEAIGVTNVRVEVRPGSILEGRVTDFSGAPLADVRLRGVWPYGEVRTDSDGWYRFAGLLPDSRARLRTGGRGVEEVSIDVHAGLGRVDFQLRRFESVRLRLIPPRGMPTPRWIACDSSLLLPKFEPRIELGWRDEWTLTGIDPEGPPLLLFAEGCDHVRVELPASAFGPDAHAVVVRLERRRPSCGQVVAESGAPIAGALVRAHAMAALGEERVFTRTDDEGRFEFPGTTNGASLWITAAGFHGGKTTGAPVRRGYIWRYEDPVVLESSRRKAAENLSRPIRAQVFDRDGVPLPHALVMWPGGRATTDGEGHFHVDDFPIPVALTVGGSRVYVNEPPPDGETLLLRLGDR